MVDFRSAISAGLKSATQAELNNREINSVIEELAKQTREVTKDVVQISIGRFMEGGIQSFFAPLLPVNNEFGFEGLAAANSNDKSSRLLLAKLERSAEGYPLTIRFSDQAFAAFDKAEVADVLVRLMMHPDTGKKLKKLQETR